MKRRFLEESNFGGGQLPAGLDHDEPESMIPLCVTRTSIFIAFLASFTKLGRFFFSLLRSVL